jgi:hypothetical protein
VAGNTSPFDARYELSDPPGSPQYANKIDKSKFEIDFPESTSPTLWASPRFPSGNAWFRKIPLNPQPNFCLGTNGTGDSGAARLSATDESVLAGDMPAYDGYAATLWDAQFRLYDKLYRAPEIRPAGSVTAAYYAAHQNEPFARLALIYEQIGEAMTPNASLQQSLSEQYAQSISLLAQIEQTDSLLAALDEPLFAQSLWQSRSGLVQDFTTENTETSQLLGSFMSNRTAQWQVLLSEVNTTSATVIYEFNLKTALRIWLESATSNAPLQFTTQQGADLESVAAQCRLAGGYGVRLARLMLPPTDYDDDCGIYPRNQEAAAGKAGQSSKISIYPNPTQGALYIGSEGDGFEGRITLYDPMGREVLSRAASGFETTRLDLSPLVNGVFILQLIDANKAVSTHRIFLNR